MSSTGSIEIRSYRTVFDLERRIYRIDRLRLNPGGIPLRGVLYCGALGLLEIVLGRLPLLAPAIGLLPWYLRFLALPVGGAALLCLVRIDGRPFHLAGWALLRFACWHRAGGGTFAPPVPRGRRREIPDLLVLCDGSDGRLRGLRFTGPGAVLLGVAHERGRCRGPLLRRRSEVGVRTLDRGAPLRRAQVLELSDGARLRVQCDAGRRPNASGRRGMDRGG